MGDVSGELFTMLVEEGVGIFSGFVVQLFSSVWITFTDQIHKYKSSICHGGSTENKYIDTNTGGLHHRQNWRRSSRKLVNIPDSSLSSH